MPSYGHSLERSSQSMMPNDEKYEKEEGLIVIYQRRMKNKFN
jgi:hypothetical protein